jgi:hypothetical protein
MLGLAFDREGLKCGVAGSLTFVGFDTGEIGGTFGDLHGWVHYLRHSLQSRVKGVDRFCGDMLRFNKFAQQIVKGIENRFYFTKKHHSEGEILDHQRRAERVQEIKIKLESLMTRKIA